MASIRRFVSRYPALFVCLVGCVRAQEPPIGVSTGPLPSPPEVAVTPSPDASVDAPPEAVAVVVDAGPPAPPDPALAVAGQEVLVVGQMAVLVGRPAHNAPWIGYLRRGARVRLARGPIEGEGCPARSRRPWAGWYQIEGGAYVCLGLSAWMASAVNAATLRRMPDPPALDRPLPFAYGFSTQPTPMFRAPPTADDERLAAEGIAVAPTPDPAAPAPTPAPRTTLEDLEGTGPVLRYLTRGMYVALDHPVRSDAGPTYWRTQSAGFVASSALAQVGRGPRLEGVALDGAVSLPLGFARGDNTVVWQMNGARMTQSSRLARWTTIPMAEGEAMERNGERYLPTRDGQWVRERQVAVVSVQSPPADMTPDEKWIDVNLDHQSVVAYEGARPVYATIVSTGLRTRSRTANFETVQGAFRIQWKHISATMDGNAISGVYSIEDVPWVMYFHDSFALHGAFWHSSFGRVHSHGCVNMSPPDARWIFQWSEPALPAGWYGIASTSSHPGSRVFVHYAAQALGEAGGPAHIPSH